MWHSKSRYAIIRDGTEEEFIMSETNDPLGNSPASPVVENELKEHNEEAAEIEEYKARLTPGQQRTWQIALGWVFGFAVWFCLALGAYYPDDTVISWLFLAVFVGAMILRKQVEDRTGISMRIFMRHLLISLVIFLVLFIILGPVTGILDIDPAA